MKLPQVAFVVLDKDGDVQGLDNGSGGYPHKAFSISLVQFWLDQKQVEEYVRVINGSSNKSFTIARVALSMDYNFYNRNKQMSIKGGTKLRGAALIAAIVIAARHQFTPDVSNDFFQKTKNKGNDWRRNRMKARAILKSSIQITQPTNKRRQELREIMQEEYGYQLVNRAKRKFKKFLSWQDKEASKIVSPK